jgi:FAD/FMN-containing dehydrogenase
LLLPGNRSYETRRRGWNALFDRRPAMIVPCQSASDVQLAVELAQRYSLLTAVRSGGHSFSGQSSCDGGLLIDLSSMKRINVNRNEGFVEVQSGAKIGALDVASLAHGLATPCGSCPDVGVGGFLLGGGIGRLSRQFGLACDNLRSAEIVTADGTQRIANAADNADLFWAIRGGGGNFGVVTSMRLQLHSVSRRVLGGRIIWPIKGALEALTAYAELTADAPDLLSIDASLDYSADDEPLCRLEVCWSGTADEGEKLLRPLRRVAMPVIDTIGPVDYLTLQAARATPNQQLRSSYQKSGFLEQFPLNATRALLAAFQGATAQRLSVAIQQMGGATERVAPDATAFSNRNARFWLSMGIAARDALLPSQIAATRTAWSAIKPFTRGLYANAVMDEDVATIRASYGSRYGRLASIKRRYDPGNLFRLNANIPPARV